MYPEDKHTHTPSEREREREVGSHVASGGTHAQSGKILGGYLPRLGGRRGASARGVCRETGQGPVL